MEPIQFAGQKQWLTIAALSIESDPALPSVGDVYVSVSVNSNGFVGSNDLWLDADALYRFYRELAALDKTLKGEVQLSSISPDELKICVRAVSSRGNVAVSGTTGYWIASENASFWHAISFGFEFEPNQISAALRQSWLRSYGGSDAPPRPVLP